EFPEQTQIEIGDSRATQDVRPGVAEPDAGDRGKREGIEVRLSRTRPAQNLDVLLHLVGALRASGSVQGRSRSAYAERRSAVAAENPVELPTAEDGARNTR